MLRKGMIRSLVLTIAAMGAAAVTATPAAHAQTLTTVNSTVQSVQALLTGNCTTNPQQYQTTCRGSIGPVKTTCDYWNWQGEGHASRCATTASEGPPPIALTCGYKTIYGFDNSSCSATAAGLFLTCEETRDEGTVTSSGCGPRPPQYPIPNASALRALRLGR